MYKKLLLQLLDIAYPNGELPVDADKIRSIYKRFDESVNEIVLCDDGKIMANGNFICDISKGREYLVHALDEITNLSNGLISISYANPYQKYIVDCIKVMNDRGRIVNDCVWKDNVTKVYFAPI